MFNTYTTYYCFNNMIIIYLIILDRNHDYIVLKFQTLITNYKSFSEKTKNKICHQRL